MVRCCRRHVVGQIFVSDISVRSCWSISPPAVATSFFHGRSGDSETVRSLSLLLVPGIVYLRNWNSCRRQQQHSSVILRHFCFTQHTSTTNYAMRIGLTVGGALQMHLLLLLFVACVLNLTMLIFFTMAAHCCTWNVCFSSNPRHNFWPTTWRHVLGDHI